MELIIIAAGCGVFVVCASTWLIYDEIKHRKEIRKRLRYTPKKRTYKKPTPRNKKRGRY